MAKLMKIYRVNDDDYYTKSEATKALKISYRTFEKYFNNVDHISTVGGKTIIFKGADLNDMVNKLVNEKVFED